MFGLSPYLLGGVTALVLALATFGGCQYQAKEKWRARAELAESGTQVAVDANTACQATVEAQDKALNQWVALAATPTELAALVGSLRDKAAQTEDLQREVNLFRQKDRALPECVALLKASLTLRCPGVVAGLRHAAAGSRENGDGGSTHPSREAAPPRTD
jgi:uncharacterized protein HemX